MQHCSPLWSASSFTLRCPFYSLFPRATLPHRPLLPVSLDTHTWTHTQTNTHFGHHAFISCFLISTFILRAELLFLSLLPYGIIIYTRKDHDSTQSQTSHIRTRSATGANVLSHTNTHRNSPVACPRILSAHASLLALGARPSPALSLWATECPVTPGGNGAPCLRR